MSIESLERELSDLEDNIILKDERVLEILLSGRLYRLRHGSETYFIFRGGERDYLIIPRVMCTCKDFIINVVLKKKRSSCLHLRSVEIATRRSSFFKDLEVEDPSRTLYNIISTGRLNTRT